MPELPAMTIAIASYQRKEPLLELLRSLDSQASTEGWEGVEVIAVIDGSTDGSKEAVDAVDFGLPVHAVFQENRGLAAARNAGLQHRSSDLVLFLDDDVIPAPGTVTRHRRAHRDGAARIVMGPYVIPDEIVVPEAVRRWWDDRHRELAATGRLTRFDQFSVANASGPADVFEQAGGFDDRFVGYGFEDYELCLRIQGLSCPILFDAEALAWHYSAIDDKLGRERAREAGRNLVRLIQVHPDLRETYFGSGYEGVWPRLLSRLPIRSPEALMTIANISGRLASALEAAGRARGIASRLLNLSNLSARASGVADLDPELLPLVYGRPRGGPEGRHLGNDEPA